MVTDDSAVSPKHCCNSEPKRNPKTEKGDYLGQFQQKSWLDAAHFLSFHQ